MEGLYSAHRRDDGRRRAASPAALRRLWPILSIAAAGLLALAGCSRHGAGMVVGRAAPGGATGAGRPQVVAASAAEVLAQVKRARGDVVLVNVWATWCQPCREEFPDLLRLRRELSGKRFKLVLVSADFADRLPEVRAFLDQRGVDFTTYLKSGPDQQFIDGLDPKWSGTLPATLIYAPDGHLAEFWEGEASYGQFRSKVAALLQPSEVQNGGVT